MAKRRYRKYYRSKGRWSSNIRVLDNSTVFATQGRFSSPIQLAKNENQSSSSVSQQYTVKNIELSFQLEYAASLENDTANIESLVVYIVYVPQGYSVSSDLVTNHPEWIMAYRFLGSPDIESTNLTTSTSFSYRNPLYIKTRMARRLQTGDSIYLLVNGMNTNTFDVDLQIHGVVRWWTKAN